VYVAIDPAGIGATVDRALDGAGDTVRHVVVCGPRPGAGKTGAAAWAEQLGRWFPTGAAHVTRSALRARLAADGRTVHVTRIEPWFGEHVEPADAAEAMRVVRHVTAAAGVRPFGTPGQTGQRMLAALWAAAGQDWPSCPPDVAELLRATSGQGRFQVFANAGGERLVSVDARFQYGALALNELPAGEPVELLGQAPDEYAPAWCLVDFVPTASPVGMLGVAGAHGWQWPTDGAHQTWCSGAEVHAARQAGYRIAVRRAIVWPSKARPLAPWARMIAKQRHRIESLPLTDGVKRAARAGLRAIVVQCIGTMHGRTAAPPVSLPQLVSASCDNETGGAAVAFDHPEWSTAIWATARVRLARQMLDQTAPVVACALDGYYVAGEPELRPDNGTPGQWREVWRCDDWPAVRTMADIYALKGDA
jgi:hypothetical protein